jgi:HK97 family phage major capsid protein
VSGGLRVYRRQETDDVASSRMQMEQVTFQAHSLMGVSYATEEILTDSPISFAAMIQEGFGDEFAAKILDEKIRGTGAGEFEGVLNCPATISVAKETGQAAATINLDNLVKMEARCWGNSPVWLANPTCKPQLANLAFVSGTGGMPFWWGSAREGLPAQLLGKPIYFTEFCEAVGTVGDIMLCDWGEYTVATLEGVKSAESMHVRFLNHERAFKFWTRNDGRSLWRSALTPKKGDSRSPFVTLATRA